MKRELLEIVNKRCAGIINAGKYVPYFETLIDALESVTEETTKSFKRLLGKYNFDTIPQFSEYPEYPAVTLFKGVDSWSLYPVIDYEGGISAIDQEISVIFTDPEIYPDEDELPAFSWELRQAIIVTWLSLIWLKIKGNSYGIVVKTLENNSASSFYFNDLAWDNLSAVRHYNNKSERLIIPFPENLDVLSVFQRVSLVTYPVYPYLNKWRFFQGHDHVIEFVRYGNETGEKWAADPIGGIKITAHKTLIDALRYEQSRCLELNLQGYTEFLPEQEGSTPLYEGAIETRFHSGEAWYYSEQKGRLDLDTISSFEKRCSIRLPYHFKHYLRLFNGRKYNNINLYFFAGNGYLKVREFFNIEELEQKLPKTKDITWIEIATLEKNREILLLRLSDSLLGIKDNDGNLRELPIDFETFIKEPVNYDPW
jgi:hypothetical protein